jgi:hypothetical protein
MSKTYTDEKIAELLMMHGSVSSVSTVTKLTRAAIYQRIKTPEFRKLFETYSHSALNAASGELSCACGTAIQTLVSVCNDTKINAQTRVQAAQTILTNAVKLADVTREQREADERDITVEAITESLLSRMNDE